MNGQVYLKDYRIYTNQKLFESYGFHVEYRIMYQMLSRC